jgi:peptidoglycan hydrolase-like protein with peptidoglycan-binding domain
LTGLNPLVVEGFTALDAIMRSFRYVPRANSPSAWETGAYNCRTITGGTGYSLHAFGIAADINARTNPYGRSLVTDMPAAMVAAIKAIQTKAGLSVFRWGGNYSGNKDAMHYEVVLSPAEIQVGIDWGTVPADPPSPGAATTWPTLRRGDSGPSVRKMTELLAAAGIRSVEPTTTFSAAVEAAVRRYQSSRGLAADGVVGLQTWTALWNTLPRLATGDPSPFKVGAQPSPARQTLRGGASGSEVEELQRRLADAGFNPGDIDGKFGQETTRAVRAYQAAHGMKVDGICGPRTWRALVG